MGRWGLNRYRSKRKPNFHTIEKDNSKELKAKIKKLEAEKDFDDTRIDNLATKCDRYTSKIKQLEAEKKELQGSFDVLDKLLKEQTKINKELIADRMTLQDNLRIIKSDIDDGDWKLRKENQRLKEVIERILSSIEVNGDKSTLCEIIKDMAQKALKG